MSGISGIVLQFLSKPEDVIVHGAGAGIALVSPDLVQKFVTADRSTTRLLDHEFQDPEFFHGERNLHVVANHFHFHKVHLHGPKHVEGTETATLRVKRAGWLVVTTSSAGSAGSTVPKVLASRAMPG